MALLDFDAIKNTALARCPDILEEWLPGGRIQGREYVCANLQGGQGDSCKVNCETGQWADFATDEKGGDLVSLYAKIHSLSQSEAARKLADILHMSEPYQAEPYILKPHKSQEPTKEQKPETWAPILPAPSEAPAPDFTHHKLGTPANTWIYKDHTSALLGYTCRFDLEDGKKQVLPLTYCQGPDGQRTWRWQGFPEPYSLYGLERIQKFPQVQVLVVEGEKAADAAQRLCGDRIVVTTFPGGCNAVSKVDWTPLKDRQVYLWPDNDGPGFKAMLAVAELAEQTGFTLAGIILPDANWDKGQDIADFPHWTWDKLNQEARSRKVSLAEFREYAKKRYPDVPITEESAKSVAMPDVVIPVDFDTPEVLPLDPTSLPAILADYCPAVAEGLQVPLELVFINALSCVSVAGQRKFRVQVRPGYSEPLNIYALAALPPGERKSVTTMECKQPLLDWEAETQAAVRDSIRAAQSEHKTLEKTIEAKRTKVANAKTEVDRRVLIDEIKKLEAELPEIPVSPRLLLDDVAPEALPAFMEKQDQRAGIIEAEGGLFDIMAGRYSKGIPNLDAVLKFWSGEPVNVDRKSGSPITLRDPALTICLSPQPEIIRGLADKPGFRGRGLLARFLFLLPRSRGGSRAVEPQTISPEIRHRYASQIRSILSLPWALDSEGNRTAFYLSLAPEAYELWKNFAETAEQELRPGGELELIADWGGKLPGAAARLAGLFHLLEHESPQTRTVGHRTMQQALDFAAILTDHAKVAFALMGAEPDIECAKHILSWIRRDRPEHFQARDALRAVEGRYPTMALVNPGLAILVERGFIFEEKCAERMQYSPSWREYKKLAGLGPWGGMP